MKNGHESSEWFAAQKAVANWLKFHGVKTTPGDYYGPFDLLTAGGKRIEVKWATFAQKTSGAYQYKRWRFNIHRHNRVLERSVDFYVLRCQGAKELGFTKAFHLVMPSPVGTPTLEVTIRALLTRWAGTFNRVDLLKQGEPNG